MHQEYRETGKTYRNESRKGRKRTPKELKIVQRGQRGKLKKISKKLSRNVIKINKLLLSGVKNKGQKQKKRKTYGEETKTT